ncbi:MAG: hypothetical protein AAFX87_22290 [Bacteroidota bacterium]
MNDILQSRAQLCKNSLDSCLQNYATNRDPNQLVGQFLDQEGQDSPQYGIFGICIWMMLTHDSEITPISSLSNNCKSYLKEIVFDEQGDRNAIELKRVTLKITYGLEALGQHVDATQEFSELRDRLEKAQRPDGGWGFFIDSTEGHHIPTAMAIRGLRNQMNLAKRLIGGIKYLKEKVSSIENYYEKLFILNSMQIAIESNNKLKKELNIDVPKLIKRTIKALIKSVGLNPAQFANPLIVDYNDKEARTRYFRLSPNSVVLLESMVLISSKDLTYLRAYSGRKVFNEVAENLEDMHQFKTEITGLRASTGTYLFTQRVLDLIIHSREASNKPNWWKNFKGWFKVSISFGYNISWNFGILTLTSVLAIGLDYYSSAYNYDLYFLRNLFIGISIKSFLDIVKSLSKLN